MSDWPKTPEPPAAIREAVRLKNRQSRIDILERLDSARQGRGSSGTNDDVGRADLAAGLCGQARSNQG